MERSEIRGGIDASRQSRITLRSIRATLLGGRSRAICAAISSRTQNKDSFAAPKILPFNDFLHFAPCAFARFDRRPALRFGDLGRTAHSRTRENPHEYATFAGP